MLRQLFVISELDPVAPAVAASWGTGEATGLRVGGSPVRALAPGAGYLRRPTLHIHAQTLADDLARVPEIAGATVIFPSVHRSESGTTCLTVHPLGNVGPEAEVGGRPSTLSLTAPRLMTDALRRLSEAGASIGLDATFESTHHGPLLPMPAFFAEIGYGEAPGPSGAAVHALAHVLPELSEDPADRVAVGIGGGHYAPHFTELALRRRWAFGHLISRHAFQSATRERLRDAVDLTPGAEGIVYARSADAEDARVLDLAPRCRDADAPFRTAAGGPTPSASSRPSGT